MLWVRYEDRGFQIVSYNIHDENGVPSLWVTRGDGKSVKVYEGSETYEYRDMIEHAIEVGEKIVVIK